MDRRVTQLRREQEKANGKMFKTLQALQTAEDVRDRRMTDEKNKFLLMTQRQEELEQLKEECWYSRETNKNEIARQRQRVMLENAFAREQQNQFLSH